MSEAMPQPFEIHVPDRQLDDLRRRIELTRWPDEQAGVAWTQGLPLATARELAQAWTSDFDWRAREARLNRFDHITKVADGAHLHAVHARADSPGAPALLVMHGWPSTFADFTELIEPLRAHFHVVVASLPGFAFSGPTPGVGWGTRTWCPVRWPR